MDCSLFFNSTSCDLHYPSFRIKWFTNLSLFFLDRPGLRNPELVLKMQGKLKSVLSNILLPQHPEQSTIFSELMTMIHDLRTLNTLHMEKFLQQYKVGTNPEESVTAAVNSLDESRSINRNKRSWNERDSTGNESPQSYDTHSSTSSVEDCSLRRSPIGSVSSSESVCSSEVLKATTNDLKIAGSALINALTTTSSAAAASCPSALHRRRATSESGQKSGGNAATVASGGKYKSRKLDSPSDSGIDSPRAQGSQSTNTSVCSSPRSTHLEETAASATQIKEEPLVDNAMHRSPKPPEVFVESKQSEEQHPLLKRALEQPPQPYNGGMGAFQDEVYKPHKKFRRTNHSSNSDECSSTFRDSPPPSLLASQLAQPPQDQPLSLLATTLRKQGPTLTPEESKRNEIIANLILDGQAPSMARQQEQGLLMCASGGNGGASAYFAPRRPPSATATSGSFRATDEAGTTISGGVNTAATTRHIPIPQAPTKPPSSHSKLASLAEAALSVAAETNREANNSLDSQPLNLTTNRGTGSDISTEA